MTARGQHPSSHSRGRGKGRQRHHPRQKDASKNFQWSVGNENTFESENIFKCQNTCECGSVQCVLLLALLLVPLLYCNIAVALTQRWNATTVVVATIHVVIIALCLGCCQVCLARVGITGNLLCLGACVKLCATQFNCNKYICIRVCWQHLCRGIARNKGSTAIGMLGIYRWACACDFFCQKSWKRH